MGRTYTLTIGDQRTEVEVSQEGESFLVRIGQTTHVVSLGAIDNGRLFSVLLDGASYEIHARAFASTFDLLVRNELFRVEVQRGRRQEPAVRNQETPGVWALRSPMTGLVAGVNVAVGDVVERGTVLLILESMKMNNELRADRGGIVEGVPVSKGERVERGDLLVQVRADVS